MDGIGRTQLEERLGELRQAREETLAQLAMIQGAINEIEGFWLPWLDEQQTLTPDPSPKDGRGGEEHGQAVEGAEHV